MGTISYNSKADKPFVKKRKIEGSLQYSSVRVYTISIGRGNATVWLYLLILALEAVSKKIIDESYQRRALYSTIQRLIIFWSKREKLKDPYSIVVYECIPSAAEERMPPFGCSCASWGWERRQKKFDRRKLSKRRAFQILALLVAALVVGTWNSRTARSLRALFLAQFAPFLHTSRKLCW